jgi:hypothetical protein
VSFEMTVHRAVIALACVSVGIATALLWDPTVRIEPSYLPENPNPPSDYFSHQFVPLRVAIAVAGLLIAVLVLTVHGRRAVQHPDPTASP